MPGLYAIGEAACVSVHGANRLGSNSLLDLVVFGRAVANRCAETIKPGQTTSRCRQRCLRRVAGATSIACAMPTAARRPAVIRDNMQRTMQLDAAVFRTGETLAEGVRKIRDIHASFADVQGQRPFAGLEFGPDRDLRAAEPARAGAGDDRVGAEPHRIARRACARGFPGSRRRELDEAQPVLGRTTTATTHIDYRPVHMYTLDDDVEVVPPKPRVY